MSSALGAFGQVGRVRSFVARWALWRAPRGFAAYCLVVDAIAIAALGLAATRSETFTLREWGSALLVTATAVVFEEGSRRVARLKIRLGPVLRPDMTSVWVVACAVALPPLAASLVLVLIVTYIWFRTFRPAGDQLFRKVTTSAAILLSCLAGGASWRVVTAHTASMSWLLGGLLGVLAAIVTAEVVNRGLVSVALLIAGASPRELLASAEDNLIELATLCLGGLVALAVVYQPWFVLLVIAPMVTLQRGALVRALETAATTDSKTGLLNAVAWEHLAEREFARARRERYAIALLIIDIDRFKRVNDEYGHLVGDEVLRRVGRAIAAEVREYDGVGRFGGEEFVAVLPEVKTVDALMIAERVRNRVNRLRVSDLVEGIAPSDGDLLSVSVGVSCSLFGGQDVSDLLREADVALYQAKAGGRNRVVLADGGAGELPDRVAH